jgi:hypothetical protein
MAASDEESLLFSLSKYTLKKVSGFPIAIAVEAAAAATAVRRGTTTNAGSRPAAHRSHQHSSQPQEQLHDQ